jgi:L-lactate dehydrogenase complex protein LldE
MVDVLYPETGLSVVEILEHLGVDLDFPMGQTCCGQTAFNGGYWEEARQVAKQFLTAFKDAELIVTPSGSCAAMVRHEFPVLFADEAEWLEEARRQASITWELTEFIVEGLGITDLHGRLAQPQKFAFHDSCHGLRLMGLKEAGRTLIGNLENASVVDWDNSETCCGFGGLFSVKMADVSGAMLHNKVENILSSDADAILSGDVSCLLHMNGGLERGNHNMRVKHIADVLADGIRQSSDDAQ